jgi:hypothetical protein
MFAFDRLKYSQIPIWENEHRIKYLTLFRDLVYDRNPAMVRSFVRLPLQQLVSLLIPSNGVLKSTSVSR